MILAGRQAARSLAHLAVAGIAVMVAGGTLAVSSPATATAAVDKADVDRDIGGLAVQVAGDIPAMASEQSQYGVMVEAVSTLRDLADVTLELAVTETPFADADALGDFIDSPAGTGVRTVASTAVGGTNASLGGSLQVGTRALTSLLVPASGFGLAADAPGVYGVVVTMKVAGESVWTRTAPLTWQPSALPTLSVTAVATISGAENRVSALLNAAGDPRVTLLVDPTALTPEQRLSLADREAYSLPSGNLDVTSAAHAETPVLIQEAVTRTRQASNLPWLALAAAADKVTVASATSEGATAVLADPRWSDLEPAEGGGAYDAGVIDGVASVPVVAVDAELSTTLATRSPTDSTTTAWVVAQAAFDAIAGAGAVVIAPGDSWGVEGTRPSRALGTLLDAPFVEPRTLDEVLSAPDRADIDLPDVTSLASDVPADEVVGAVSELTRLEALATATTSESAMITDAALGLLQSLSLENRSYPTYRAEEVAEASEVATAVLSAVSVTSGSQVLLVSSSGSVPITVSNALDVPVIVRIAVTSRSPILGTKSSPVATIEAGADATVTVPVEAISSGDVNVSVAIRTEDGATLAVAETLKVRVRAAWGNVATGTFTAGLVVLLIAGVVRTIRRGRKDTRVRPTDETAVAGASTADA